MSLMQKSLKGLLAPALGLALVAPQVMADEPKNSNPPAPAKKVEPKAHQHTKEAHKVTKKAKPATPVKHTKKAHQHPKEARKVTRKVKPAMPKDPRKAPAVHQAGH